MKCPTKKELATLASYLPRLYADGFNPIEKWEGGTENPEGVVTMPWPRYAPIVEEFFRAASAECWRDYGYRPADAGQKIMGEEYVSQATLDQVKEMLTYCVRGERFCAGFWGDVIEKGYVRRLLQRITEL